MAWFIPIVGNAVTDTDLVAYWPCDETSGVRYDSFANNDLTDVNTVGYAGGKVSYACDFNAASSEYLTRTYDGTFDPTGDYAVSFWFLSDSTSGLHRFTGNEGSGVGWLFYSNNASFYWIHQGNTSLSLGSISTATWYHVCASYDSASTWGDVYVSSGTTFDSAPSSGDLVGYTSSSQGFKIGVGTGDYYDGLIDEFAYFDRQLSETDCQDLFNSGSPLAYGDLFSAATSSTSTAQTATSTDMTELMQVFTLYMAVLLYVIFTIIGYFFVKWFF